MAAAAENATLAVLEYQTAVLMVGFGNIVTNSSKQ